MRAVLLAALFLAVAPGQAGAAIGFVTENGMRTPVALLDAHGLLTSDSTRIDGLVTRAESRPDGSERSRPNPVAALDARRPDRAKRPATAAADDRSRGADDRARLRPPHYAFRALLVALAANLWLSPLLALRRGNRRAPFPLGLACAGILGGLPRLNRARRRDGRAFAVRTLPGRAGSTGSTTCSRRCCSRHRSSGQLCSAARDPASPRSRS